MGMKYSSIMSFGEQCHAFTEVMEK